MPVQLTETADQIALEASFQLHREMLAGDGFYGYDGSIDAFQNLTQECLFIIEEQLIHDDNLDDVIYQFHLNQAEISEGERDACYWMA
jgi:hypothetical protein